ncbi:extracellular solute-binding protein [Lactococcus hircilactis]|uniref:Extracellular solute-binding protein n=1 Tax=Lactococcus hircilactis TaxID=1494462 RepID=A0A7X1ZAH0_9LACT|nr:extracellular solute-binding protein [Lactococcus hircilactis]MQW40264.1 extracellular solute-binding protein [Lactococcus hircilactis]
MRTISKVILGSASVVAAISLAACSSNQSASGKQTIEVFSTKTENASTLKKLASDFHKENPNITVNITAPADGGTVLKTRLTKNNIPDVISGGGDATFLELAKAGVLEDLSDQGFVKNLQEPYLKAVTSMYGGSKIYGVPYATNASGIVYNKDIFAKYNIEAPKTWDEFTKAIGTLKSNGVTPLELGFQGTDDWTTMCIWNSVAPSIQPSNFSTEVKQNKTTFTKDMKPVAQKFLDVIDFGQNNFMGKNYNNTLSDFASGKSAMIINGSWTVPVIRQTNAKINFGLIPFPTTNDVSKNKLSSGVDVLFAVGKNSSHKSADKKFVSFMMKKENATKYINEQVAFSAVKGVEQTDPAMISVKDYIAKGDVTDYPDHLYPAGFQMAGLLSQLSLNKTKGMSDSSNISQFLKTADQQYKTANTSK